MKWRFDKTTIKAGTMHDLSLVQILTMDSFYLNKTMSLELFVTMTVTMHEPFFVQFALTISSNKTCL